MSDQPALLIIADDLTGAADCAARWRKSGMAAEVRLARAGGWLPGGATALVSDTRHLSAESAARQVADLLASARAPGDARWYKKIDSTLRGNLGAELDAALAALGRSHALICPAFPDQRRGLQAGRLVCPPEVASPVDLPGRLAEQSRRVAAVIPLDLVRAGRDALAADMRDAAARASLLVCDALTNADLALVAEAAAVALPRALLCGSAGLIGALAALELRGQPIQPPAPPPSCARALVVVGSGSAMAHRQIAELRRRYDGAISATLVDAGHALEHATGHDDAQIELLYQPPPAPGVALDGPEARARAELLAEVAASRIGELRPDLLILVGGDTAMALLRRLAVDRLVLLRELMPGVPLARAVAAGGRETLAVLKAGSFGGAETLADMLAMCMRGDPAAL